MTREELLKLNEIIKASASFNISDITNVLAKLISFKEKKNYIPVIYSNNNWDMIKFFAAIMEDFMFDNYRMYKYDSSRESFVSTMIGGEQIGFIDIYHSINDAGNLNKKIVFGRLLLGGFNIECDPNYVTYRNFSLYPYVNQFIDYLFELQLINDGKQLTYEEMVVALNKFLELEKDKPKTKKLINSTSE